MFGLQVLKIDHYIYQLQRSTLAKLQDINKDVEIKTRDMSFGTNRRFQKTLQTINSVLQDTMTVSHIALSPRIYSSFFFGVTFQMSYPFLCNKSGCFAKPFVYLLV